MTEPVVRMEMTSYDKIPDLPRCPDCNSAIIRNIDGEINCACWTQVGMSGHYREWSMKVHVVVETHERPK